MTNGDGPLSAEIRRRIDELNASAAAKSGLTEDGILAGITDIALNAKADRDRLNALVKLGEAMETPMFGMRQKTDAPPSRTAVIAQFAVFLPIVGVPKVIEMLKLAGIEATEDELSG